MVSINKLIFLFAFTVPLFFCSIVIGLYFITTQETIEGSAFVSDYSAQRYYAPRSALISKILVKDNQHVEKGDLLLVLEDERLINEIFKKESTIEMGLQTLSQEKLILQDLSLVSEEDQLALSQERLSLTERRLKVLEVRLEKYRDSAQRGSYSKQAVDDIEYDYHRAQLNVFEAKQNFERIKAGSVRLSLEQQKTKISSLEIKLKQDTEQLKRLKLLEKGLLIRAKESGTIVHLTHQYPGVFTQQGEWLLSVDTDQKVEVEIAIEESKINKIKLGQKVRFESSTFSVNQSYNEYYSGKVISIQSKAQLDKNQLGLYTGRGYYTIKAELNPHDHLPFLPMGSTGISEVIMGPKSLLLQIIGWE